MKLQSIQILRGIAALMVVVFHIRALEKLAITENGFSELPLIGGLWTNGYAGVDLFFVISGFIMIYVTGRAQSGQKSAVAFFFARATRIYPIWWVFASIMTVYMVVAHGILDVEGKGWGAVGRTQDTVPYLIKSFLLIAQGEHPVLGVGWTLVHEMYFYVMFTAMLFAPRKLWPWLLGGWASVVIAGSLAGLSAPIADSLIALATYPMTIEFILGAAAGLLVTSGRRYRPAAVTLLSTIWMMAALCLQGTETAHTLLWGRVLWFGLPAAALVYGLACLDVAHRLPLLVPVGIAALITGLIFQLYSPAVTAGLVSVELATGMALLIGAIAIGVVLWIGFTLGKSKPEMIHAMRPLLRWMKDALVKMGDWSYAFYLSHIIVLVVIQRIFGAIAGFLEVGGMTGIASIFRLGRPALWDNLFFLAVGLSASLIVAWLSYRYIEKPLIRYFAKKRSVLFGDASNSLKPAKITAAIW